MPIVSVQTYVKNLLQGLTPPGKTGIHGAISALVTPLDPDVNPDGIARVYVWPATAPEKRIAMPRNNAAIGSVGGFKQLKHDLHIFLMWMDIPQDTTSDVNFPELIDFVMNVLRTSGNPTLFTDPGTGNQSQIVNLGEDMTYEFVPPRTLDPQLMRRYDAWIRCSLLEIFQA